MFKIIVFVVGTMFSSPFRGDFVISDTEFKDVLFKDITECQAFISSEYNTKYLIFLESSLKSMGVSDIEIIKEVCTIANVRGA